MMWSKALVTGGAGFIGSHLVDRLVADGVQVIVLDNLYRGTKLNLIQSRDKIKFFEGDIQDSQFVDKIVKENSPDIIFHLAANASVPDSADSHFQNNVVGTFNVLNALKDNASKRIVFASSAAIYGESQSVMKEEDRPSPVSPYGSSKLCGEVLGHSFKHTIGIQFVAARIFNVYGPRLSRYVMYDLYRKLKANPFSLEVLGNGKQMRQFCYITDTVEALLLLGQEGNKDGNEVYNIAGSEVISIEALAKVMISKVAPKAKLKFTGNSWLGDIKNLTADIGRIQSLGFQPKVKLETGIGSTIDWFKANI